MSSTTVPPTTQPPIEPIVQPSDIVDYDDRMTVTTITKCRTYMSTNKFILGYLPNLKTINIGDNCWKTTKTFKLDSLDLLESVVIGKKSFLGEQVGSSYQITNCPKLKSIRIGITSFRNYESFELNNLPSLQSIVFNDYCFEYAPIISLTGLIDGLV